MGGGGCDTGCSLNRNQLPLKENTDKTILEYPTHPPSSSVLRLQVGNFDGCTKRCLGDRGVEIRRTIRAGKGGGGVGQQEGGVHHVRQVHLFFHTPPLLLYAGWRKNEVP